MGMLQTVNQGPLENAIWCPIVPGISKRTHPKWVVMIGLSKRIDTISNPRKVFVPCCVNCRQAFRNWIWPLVYSAECPKRYLLPGNVAKVVVPSGEYTISGAPWMATANHAELGPCYEQMQCPGRFHYVPGWISSTPLSHWSRSRDPAMGPEPPQVTRNWSTNNCQTARIGDAALKKILGLSWFGHMLFPSSMEYWCKTIELDCTVMPGAEWTCYRPIEYPKQHNPNSYPSDFPAMESGPLMFYSKTWVAEGPGRWRRLVASSAGEKWLPG